MPIPPAPPVIVPPVVEEKPAPQPAPESAQASAQAAEPAQTTKEADLTASISRKRLWRSSSPCLCQSFGTEVKP